MNKMFVAANGIPAIMALFLHGACIRYDSPAPLTFFKDDPGSVQFRLVLEEAESREHLLAKREGAIRDTQEIIVHESSGGLAAYYLVNKNPDLDGSAIASAEFKPDEYGAGQVLLVTFKPGPEGADIMGRLTAANLDKKLAMIVRGRVVSAPVIRERVSDQAQITGLTREEIVRLNSPQP